MGHPSQKCGGNEILEEDCEIVDSPELEGPTTRDSLGRFSGFIYDVSRYYRDFLDTDFKRQRLPKRSITNRDRAGSLTGVALRKYPSFEQEVWRCLNEPLDGGLRMTIARGRHRSELRGIVRTVIDRQVDAIRTDTVTGLRDAVLAEAKNQAQHYKGDPESYHASVVSTMQSQTLRVVVRPLIDNLESHFERASSQPIEAIFEVEDELTERLTADCESAIGEALGALLVDGDAGELGQMLGDHINASVFRDRISAFFDNFAAGDLYAEINGLVNTVHLQDSLETYLYVGEAAFERHTYPVFYLAVHIERNGTTYTLTADPHLYINKKALDYIAQEISRQQQGSVMPNLVKDRVVYLERGDVFSQSIQGLADGWLTAWGLRGDIDFTIRHKQQAKSAFISLTNGLNLAAFDKSDESLLNDYEELLTLAEGGDEEVEKFANLITTFLTEDPDGVDSEVDRQWTDREIGDKLVGRSPIPLNEEQRKIISALKNDKCRFVRVQGPPGTGKSHTITALVFDAILDNRNVLVLSDKKEALDVVEDKLKQTLASVRLDTEFQNPILRLGRGASSYTKIVTGSSIQRIRAEHMAAESHKEEFESEILEGDAALKDKVRRTAEASEEIDIKNIVAFTQQEHALERGFTGVHNYVEDPVLANALDGAALVTRTLNGSGGVVRNLLNSLGDPSLDSLANFLGNYQKIRDFRISPLERKSICFFSSVCAEDIDTLEEFLRRYQRARLPIFGFLFSANNARRVDADLAKALDCVSGLDAHKKLRELVLAHGVLARLRQYLNQLGITADTMPLVFRQIIGNVRLKETNTESVLEGITKIKNAIEHRGPAMEALGVVAGNLLQWTDSRSGHTARIAKLVDYRVKHKAIRNAFNTIPVFDYAGDKGQLESLYTRALATVIDGRVIDFFENRRAVSRDIRDIIKKKQKFPKDRFEDLKRAFPCIIAGIRDYAEYVPLEAGLFDLVIIDEASQVSIAQAMPAIIRAKKLVVLGDHNQFSNVKTMNASIAINNHYVREIKENFVRAFGNDAGQISRLEKFNIRTSILEFVEMIANYAPMLRKHFRGYPELISFSSSTFYDNSLQSVKIRGKPIDDVIVFDMLEHDGLAEVKGNINQIEAEHILSQLKLMLLEKDSPSVGVITPFSDQQVHIARLVDRDEDGRDIHERLRFKAMTFDSCQGEERDVVFYSMVATAEVDRLNAIFPKNLEMTGDVENILRMQRLNVGFSRGREQLRFVLSKPLEKYAGAIGSALRHYKKVLDDGRLEPMSKDVDPNSPMEKHLLHWVKETRWYKDLREKGALELVPQFPIGIYLKQLDPHYNHPEYRVDFLAKIQAGSKTHSIIIEYDGFKEHFTNLDEVDVSNYRHYYRASDVEREKILESYGYKMLRVNRFNLGRDPVDTLNERLLKLTSAVIGKNDTHDLISKSRDTAVDIGEGKLKKCSKCGELKPIKAFADAKLKRGVGRICRTCKNKDRRRSPTRSRRPRRRRRW